MKINNLCLVLVFLLFGCGPHHDVGASMQTAKDQKNDKDSLIEEGVNFDQVKSEFLAPNCLGCHQGTTAAGGIDLSEERFLFEQELISPGEPDKSYLFTITENGEMPPRSPIPIEALEVLREYISGLPQL